MEKPRTLEQEAIDRMAKILKDMGYGEDNETGVADLLTDIRHFCDAQKLDFHINLDRSYNYYCLERNGGI